MIKSNEKEEISDLTIEDILGENKLVLLNDNHNSFEHVIFSLIAVMGYSLEQSEQISILVHNKGQAVIKTGSFIELQEYYEKLYQFNLTIEIQ